MLFYILLELENDLGEVETSFVFYYYQLENVSEHVRSLGLVTDISFTLYEIREESLPDLLN